MEIRRTGSGARIAVPIKETERDGVPAAAVKNKREQSRTDRLELTRQWVEQMDAQRQEAERAMLQGNKKKESQGPLSMLEQLEESSGDMDALLKELKAKLKCAKIAANIMAGKRVPRQDEKFLRDNDPKGYQMAILMRKKDPDEKECKSELDEEDLAKGESTQGDASAPASAPAPVVSAAPAEGGGEASVE